MREIHVTNEDPIAQLVEHWTQGYTYVQPVVRARVRDAPDVRCLCFPQTVDLRAVAAAAAR